MRRVVWTRVPGTTSAVIVEAEVEGSSVEVIAAVGDADRADYTDALRADEGWLCGVEAAARE